MNFKTTVYLTVLLVSLVAAYSLLRRGGGPAEQNMVETSPVGASAVARNVLDTELGDVSRIVCQREGEDEWVFEKSAQTENSSTKEWYMTSPLTFKALSWEVDRISRQLPGTQYEVSYLPGQAGGVTVAEAGLEPPVVIVTLTDEDGTSASIEIGKPASQYTTFVRVAGKEEIYVAMASLRDLVKPKLLDYRDKQLWSFQPVNAVRVEIVDRSGAGEPVNYTFGLDGKRWMMESPATARATSKVDDMLRGMSRLRAINWHDDRPERLAAYGLEEAALTVRVTVEEAVKKEEGKSTEGPAEEGETGEEPAEPEVEIKSTVYELHVSNQSPIGEDTKAYIRPGDAPAVATIMKTVTDKFKPVMSDWRDMQITPVDVRAANRIEISTVAGSTTLIKDDGGWSFEADTGPAEESVVAELLDAVSDLKAVAFVDGEPSDLAAFGLAEPQADIRLTIPGVENVERIAIGGYTDAKTRRLVYARRNEVASVAKLRAADVNALTRGPQTYRDRTVVNVPRDTVEQIGLSMENRYAGGRAELTFTRVDGAWKMSLPIEAPVSAEEFEGLVGKLSRLRAQSIAADSGELSAYGLDEPKATVTISYGSSAKGETQNPSVELAVTEHRGKVYAKRGDRTTIYQLSGESYDQLFAEYRTDEVWTFDESSVRHFAIKKGDVAHAFERADDRWTYQSEPDLPLDTNKVENLLLQLKDLRTQRYVTHGSDDPEPFGLVKPHHEITITLDDGTTKVLSVSDQACPADPENGFYATVQGQRGVFLLSPATVERFAVSLDTLESKP